MVVEDVRTESAAAAEDPGTSLLSLLHPAAMSMPASQKMLKRTLPLSHDSRSCAPSDLTHKRGRSGSPRADRSSGRTAYRCPMRSSLSEDDFDDLEMAVSRGSTEDHRAAAAHLVALAQEVHPDDEVSTGDLLAAAGEQFRFADDPQRALEVLWRAYECRDWDDLDPRAVIVDVLLDQGEPARAQEVSEQVRRSRPRDASTYLYLGELWEDKDETKRALGWFMRGIMLVEQRGLSEADLSLLCLGRWRIRQRDEQEPDEYDEVAIQFQEHLNDHIGG